MKCQLQGRQEHSNFGPMYFDTDYWWRVVRHTWGLRSWRGRNAMLAKLLLWIPLRTALHTLCFLLDYVFFPAL